MAISVGDKLPNTQFLVMQDGIASPLEFEEISKGRKIILEDEKALIRIANLS